MKIGRVIWKYDAQTWVRSNKNCYSSCALIYIAGVSRINGGKLGLHRPYLASAPQDRASIEQHIPKMLADVKSYVSEMGITDSFYQQMVNTEPSRVITYDISNVKKLVPVKDPVWEEIEISKDARQYGVTTDQMRYRENEAKKKCDSRPLDERVECEPAIKWGLSEQVYRERAPRADEICQFNDQDRDILKKVPRKHLWDHPLLVNKFTDCRRSIMLGRRSE